MSRFEGKICPFCKCKFDENDEVVICSECEMPHHKMCWIENRGCTTFGCQGTIQGIDDAVDFDLYNNSNDELEVTGKTNSFCGKCGAMLASEGAYCVKCGALVKSQNDYTSVNSNDGNVSMSAMFNNTNNFISNKSSNIEATGGRLDKVGFIVSLIGGILSLFFDVCALLYSSANAQAWILLLFAIIVICASVVGMTRNNYVKRDIQTCGIIIIVLSLIGLIVNLTTISSEYSVGCIIVMNSLSIITTIIGVVISLVGLSK